MKEVTVKDIMTEFIETISVGSTVTEASQIMSKIEIGAIVVAQKGKPVGMLTERDIVTKVTALALDPSKVLVEDIMTRPIITIGPEEIIDEAALMMSTYKIRRLMVVGRDGKASGIITTTDIASWLSRNEDYKNNTLNAIVRLNSVHQDIPYK